MLDDPEDLDSRTPTQTLMDCLEDFGKSEPTRVLVIYTNEDHEIAWPTNGTYSYTHLVGMIECVKARLLAGFLKGFDD